MPNSSQRTLILLSLLQTRVWTGRELAERLGVSSRTVRRDIDALRELGYPVDAIRGGQGGYRLLNGAQLPPLAVDDEEAVAIAVGLRLAVTYPLRADDNSAARALTKLTEALPRRLRRRVDSLAEAITAHPFPIRARPVDPSILLILAAAITSHERVQFTYERPGRAVERRRIEPHAVLAASHTWQLLAYDLDRTDWRTFRLDRVGDLTATGLPTARRDIPGGDAAAFVAAEARRAIPTYEADVSIVGELDEIATRLGDAGDGRVADQGDGTCRWHSPPDTLEWLTLRLARLGLAFEIHGPEELIAHVHALGHTLMAATAKHARHNR